MSKLIEALQIFLKYGDPNWPTHCEHDVLYIMDIDKEKMTPEDKEKIEELGFFWDEEFDCWASFKFGSA